MLSMFLEPLYIIILKNTMLLSFCVKILNYDVFKETLILSHLLKIKMSLNTNYTTLF